MKTLAVVLLIYILLMAGLLVVDILYADCRTPTMATLGCILRGAR